MIDRTVVHPPLVFAAHDPGRSHHGADPFPFGRAGPPGTLSKRPLATLPHEDHSPCGNGTPSDALVAHCAPALTEAGA